MRSPLSPWQLVIGRFFGDEHTVGWLSMSPTWLMRTNRALSHSSLATFVVPTFQLSDWLTLYHTLSSSATLVF